METKTPEFDALIQKTLTELKPFSKKCNQCSVDFEITENDINFFRKFKVPIFKMCLDCRRQRRLAFLNYTTLFKRKCSAPGHDEKIISTIPEGVMFPVYDYEAYWHGKRNWRDYGRDYDFDKKFFEQFRTLFLKSPQMATTRDPININCEYTCYGTQLKNCYYTFGGMNAEEILFSLWPMATKNSMDLLISVKNDFIYEGVYPENCYNCNFVYFSRDCLDCNFIHDCRNCSDCFGCVNLRNQKYCIWNKQYSKEEYFKLKKAINIGDQRVLDDCRQKFYEIIKNLPIRATRNEHSVESSGNYIVGSKNAINSMWAMNCDSISYVDFVIGAKDSFDSILGANVEKLCGTTGVGNNCFDVKFSVFGRDIRECEYVINCRNCTNCFGCIGIDNAKFCIFNKEYDEKKYWKLVDKIKSKMLQENEYGELFPMSISPFPYNASLANIVYQMSKEKVQERGGWWHEEKNSLPKEIELIDINNIKFDINDISDDILEKGILSQGNGKPFRITKKELDFYRRKNLSIPSYTPYERIVSRFEFVNNFKVVKDKCFKCNVEILSSYSTISGYRPYCEKCYQQEVY